MNRSEEMSVKSAERVLDVIDYLTSADEGATLMELSKRLDIPKSSMSQLLGTMARKNYLVKTEGNIYKLGYKLIIAGNKARTSNDIYSASISILKNKVVVTGETLFLAIRSSTEIIYLAKVDSDNSHRTTAQPGVRKPLHSTGLGKTFLTYEDEEVREQLLESINYTQFTPKTITNKQRLNCALEKYEKQGYVIDDEEGEEGVFCIAAPILDDTGKIIAAISCAGNRERMLERKEVIAEEIVKSANEISRTQGFNF